MTPAQLQLRNLHGTPDEFREACAKAVPSFISIDEAKEAVEHYRRDWVAAGNGAKGE